MRVLSAPELETIMKPDGYDYNLVSNIQPGDKVRWWNQDAEVISIEIKKGCVYVSVIDPLDRSNKKFKYQKEDELLVKRLHDSSQIPFS